MAHVAEERRLRDVELSELRVRVAQGAVRSGELEAPLDHFTFHGLAHQVRSDELGDVFHSMQDVLDFAIVPEHGDVLRAPVLRLEAAIGPPYVVLLNGHGVRCARGEHAIERRPQIGGTGRFRIVGVVGEDFEQPLLQGLGRGVGGAEASACGRHHRVARGVGQQDEEDVGRLLKEESEVELGSGHAGMLNGRTPPVTWDDAARARLRIA